MRTLALLSLLGCQPDPSPHADPPAGSTSPTTTAPPTTPATPTPPAAIDLDDALDVALGVLRARLDPTRYGSVDDLVPLRVFDDPRGLLHVHLRQTVGGVPVFGGEGIVHLRSDGSVRAITNDFATNLFVDTTPTISAADAIARVQVPAEPPPFSDVDGQAMAFEPTAELWVLPHEGAVHLVWLVQLFDYDPEAPSRVRVFVDAHTGEEVWRYDNLQTVDVATATQYDGTQTVAALPVSFSGTPYHITEDSGRFLTVVMAGSGASLGYYYNATPVGTPFADAAAGSIHWAAALVDDYLWTIHGRDLIDDLGGPGAAFLSVGDGQPVLTGVAHQYQWPYGYNYNNAYWDGANALFAAGNGNGVAFSPLVSLDVVAHEMAHGVTEYTAGLIYANESGALNESVSDVFGAAVEAWRGASTQEVWEIGEDCRTPLIAGDALRYMADPTADGSSRDHYDTRYVGTADNGGVHWNSGIGNLAFYLASEGGNHPTNGGTPLTGLGIEVTEQIWYVALSTYATASTDFRDFRQATLLAAEDLGYANDSAEWETLEAAWTLVGVTPWVLLPSGWASNGVGSPSVIYRQSDTGQSDTQFIMAFETQTGPASATCPNGQWSIGLATSDDGQTFVYDSSSALIGPAAGTYRSCVVAHPTLMLAEGGTSLHLWFKAEKDTTQCPEGDTDCLYSGIGYAAIGSNLSTVSSVSTAPVVTTSEPMGYPSVVRSAGTYVMALQRYPDIYVATATTAAGPWTVQTSPVMTPGAAPFAADEVYNPALVCRGDTTVPATGALDMYVGGRDRGGNWGPVIDGGVGRATSTTLSTWVPPSGTLYPYDGNEDWRHFSVIRTREVGGAHDQLIYYSETVGGVNRIGMRSTAVDWTPADLASRTCPQPSGWF